MNPRWLSVPVTSPLALLLAVQIGCSPAPTMLETAKVSGRVTYDGKPIVVGSISMHVEGGWFGSGIIEKGEYTIAKAPVGSVRVVVAGSMVERPPDEDTEKNKWADIGRLRERAKKLQAEGKNIEDEPPETPPENPNLVPKKYGGDFTTPIVREVTSGEQVINIDIAKE